VSGWNNDSLYSDNGDQHVHSRQLRFCKHHKEQRRDDVNANMFAAPAPAGGGKGARRPGPHEKTGHPGWGCGRTFL